MKCCAIADPPLPCICQVTQKYADILYTWKGHFECCKIHKWVIMEGLKYNQPLDMPPDLICNIHQEGGVRGVRKPQNRTEIRQKTATRIGFFPEYRNRTYMEATI